MPHGKLSVVVEGAIDIKDPGIRGGRHPMFGTTFEFDIDRATNELKVCIYIERGSSKEGEMVGYSTAEEFSDVQWSNSPAQNRSNYRNLLGSASGVCKESPHTFLRYGNPYNSQTPNQTYPNSSRPRIEQDQQLQPGKTKIKLGKARSQYRPSVVVEKAREATNDFAHGVGCGIAEALGDELVNGFRSGAGPAKPKGQPLNLRSRTT